MHLQDVKKSGCLRRERGGKEKRLKETLFPSLGKTWLLRAVSSRASQMKSNKLIDLSFILLWQVKNIDLNNFNRLLVKSFGNNWSSNFLTVSIEAFFTKLIYICV